jgi:hypothetical protein
MMDRKKPRMGTTKDLLDIGNMENEYVQIMSKNMMIDKETGRQANYSQTAWLRGCDGMFLYYSFDPEGPFSGAMPISEIMDIIRIDHMQNLLEEEDKT